MFETSPRTEQTQSRTNQRRRLLIALALLMIALGLVLTKDRDFWFGSDEATDGSADTENVAKTVSKPAPAPAKAAVPAPVVEAANSKKQVAPKISAPLAAQPQKETVNPQSPVVAASRTILPPLEVEVVAGDTHRTVRPGSNASKVEILTDSNRNSNRGTAMTSSVAGPATNAAEHERLTPGVAAELRQSVETTYPLLAQHSRVQGSVVLQALVGADGVIENLRVVSGPSILTAAAQQAVREWRFKPVLQNGQPVETKATITVNFSIRVSDTPPANAS